MYNLVWEGARACSFSVVPVIACVRTYLGARSEYAVAFLAWPALVTPVVTGLLQITLVEK